MTRVTDMREESLLGFSNPLYASIDLGKEAGKRDEGADGGGWGGRGHCWEPPGHLSQPSFLKAF